MTTPLEYWAALAKAATPGPYYWENHQQDGDITEHLLRSPSALYRYWYDEPSRRCILDNLNRLLAERMPDD